MSVAEMLFSEMGLNFAKKLLILLIQISRLLRFFDWCCGLYRSKDSSRERQQLCTCCYLLLQHVSDHVSRAIIRLWKYQRNFFTISLFYIIVIWDLTIYNDLYHN